MKLINFLDFEPLIKNNINMKAPAKNAFNFDICNKKELKLDLISSIKCNNLIILENFRHINKGEDNTLLFGKDKRVVLYIREFVKKDNYSYPKYHVSECDIIKKFRAENKSSRFVIHTRDDENFHINEIENNEVKAVIVNLNVCGYCLKNINWHEKEFSLKKFFAKYPKDLVKKIPKYTSDTAPLNYYSSHWPEISKIIKKASKFKCEECNIYLGTKENLNFLHVHHINGEKNDNRRDNLQTLCYECHANRPSHEHMKRDLQFLKFQEMKKTIL